MKNVSVALDAAFVAGDHHLAPCLRLTRTDGVVIYATDHDQDLTIDGHIYESVNGGTATDIESSAALNVDNSEFHGLLELGDISEADLRAGLYDYATYSRFLVNYADLSQGKYRQQDGTIGQVTVERTRFIAELRGLMQALQQSFGRTCTPTCPYILGDADCTQDLATFTVTGTLDSVSVDQLTLYDSARTEPGPIGGIAITAISHANPCVITTASAVSSLNGEAITLSGILGPVRLNGVWTVAGKDRTTFNIGIDTTDTAVYPAYAGSGIATPLGATSGYFDFGLITITSGANAGIAREVKSYVPGQWTLQEGFPHALAGTETYTMIAGCDKTAETCRTKFDNFNNFGGFPFVPGLDSIAAVGRKE